MTYCEPTRRPARRIRRRRILAAGLLFVIAGLAAAAVGYQPIGWSSTSAPPMVASRSVERAALGEAAGAVPARTTVFDDDVPGVARLDPALLGALRHAASDAADDGFTIYVDSGWRSRQYQEHLLQQAVSKYGSRAEAARWVATPSTSAHVSGDAVDIGPASAASWLSRHGVSYGLCQIYRNESWHFELRPEAIDLGCPAMYADPAQDPRMRQ